MTFIWVTGWTLGAEALQWKPEKCQCGVQFEQVLASEKRLMTEQDASLPLGETKVALRDQPGNGQREPGGGSNMEEEGKRKPEKIIRPRKRTLPNWEEAPMWEGVRVGLTNQSSEASLEAKGPLGEGHSEPIKSEQIVWKRKRKPEKVVRLRKRTLPDPEGCEEVLGFEPYELQSELKNGLGEDRSKLVESNSTVRKRRRKPEKVVRLRRSPLPNREGESAVAGLGQICQEKGLLLAESPGGTWNEEDSRSVLEKGQRTTPKEGLLVASRAEIIPKAARTH